MADEPEPDTRHTLTAADFRRIVAAATRLVDALQAYQRRRRRPKREDSCVAWLPLWEARCRLHALLQTQETGYGCPDWQTELFAALHYLETEVAQIDQAMEWNASEGGWTRITKRPYDLDKEWPEVDEEISRQIRQSVRTIEDALHRGEWLEEPDETEYAFDSGPLTLVIDKTTGEKYIDDGCPDQPRPHTEAPPASGRRAKKGNGGRRPDPAKDREIRDHALRTGKTHKEVGQHFKQRNGKPSSESTISKAIKRANEHDAT